MVKTVGNAHYVHRSNVEELYVKYVKIKDRDLFIKFVACVEQNGPKYDILKYTDNGNITLITSPDWDIANEPIVGLCYYWKSGYWFDKLGNLCNCKVTKNFRQVYHNKWMFVSDDYKGFDIETAKQRTTLWNSLPDIKEVKKYIGNKEYWVNYLGRYGIEV